MTTAGVQRGRLKIGDEWNAIVLLARDYEVLKQLPARSDKNYFAPMTPEQMKGVGEGEFSRLLETDASTGQRYLKIPVRDEMILGAAVKAIGSFLDAFRSSSQQ